jgi:hypothetical protein
MPAIAEMAGEPLLAIAEHDGVLGCGPAGCGAGVTHSVVPSAFRFDRVTKNGQGSFESTPGEEVTIASELRSAWEVHGAAAGTKQVCLPWVRISRDPTKFRACLAAARTLGPMKSAKDIYKLLAGKRGPFGSSDDEFMLQQDQEIFVVVLLDTQLQVRGVGEISRGARDSVQTPIPDILRLPIVDGAKSIVVAHNHPSGKVDPSKADKALTKALASACNTVGIDLFDHVIVTPDSYYSFANAGLIHI